MRNGPNEGPSPREQRNALVALGTGLLVITGMCGGAAWNIWNDFNKPVAPKEPEPQPKLVGKDHAHPQVKEIEKNERFDSATVQRLLEEAGIDVEGTLKKLREEKDENLRTEFFHLTNNVAAFEPLKNTRLRPDLWRLPEDKKPSIDVIILLGKNGAPKYRVRFSAQWYTKIYKNFRKSHGMNVFCETGDVPTIMKLRYDLDAEAEVDDVFGPQMSLEEEKTALQALKIALAERK